jgi:GNAT superfamily N-acetyltransferase
MSITIRLLEEADLEVADAIMVPAYGSPTSRLPELQRYLRLVPNHWVLALYHDEPAGMGGSTNFGSFAYIGLMAVHPRFQHRGIASEVMRHLLAWNADQGIKMTLLDASQAGEKLYEKLDFADEDKVVIYNQDDCALRPRPSELVKPMTQDDLAKLAAYDAPIFGGNRSNVIATYFADFSERAFVSRDLAGNITGYLIAQDSRIGPWVASDPSSAEQLLAAALTLPFVGAPQVLLPALNRSGSTLLMRYGFSPQRMLRHMRLGGDATPTQRTLLYGQASFAIG